MQAARVLASQLSAWFDHLQQLLAARRELIGHKVQKDLASREAMRQSAQEVKSKQEARDELVADMQVGEQCSALMLKLKGGELVKLLILSRRVSLPGALFALVFVRCVFCARPWRRRTQNFGRL